MIFKILCICLFVSSSKNIGNNGPLPLPMYCALPIASHDLIECTYFLNDLSLNTDIRKAVAIIGCI